MRIRFLLVTALIMFSPIESFAQSQQLAGVGANPMAGNSDTSQASEPAIISPHFSGATIGDYHYWPYDSVPVALGPNPTQVKTVLGAHTAIAYYLPQGTPPIAVQHYYESLIRKYMGGVVYSCDNSSCSPNGAATSDACISVDKRLRGPNSPLDVAAFITAIDPGVVTECHFFVGFIPSSASNGDIYVSVFNWQDNERGNGMLLDVVEASAP